MLFKPCRWLLSSVSLGMLSILLLPTFPVRAMESDEGQPGAAQVAFAGTPVEGLSSDSEEETTGKEPSLQKILRKFQRRLDRQERGHQRQLQGLQQQVQELQRHNVGLLIRLEEMERREKVLESLNLMPRVEELQRQVKSLEKQQIPQTEEQVRQAEALAAQAKRDVWNAKLRAQESHDAAVQATQALQKAEAYLKEVEQKEEDAKSILEKAVHMEEALRREQERTSDLLEKLFQQGTETATPSKQTIYDTTASARTAEESHEGAVRSLEAARQGLATATAAVEAARQEMPITKERATLAQAHYRQEKEKVLQQEEVAKDPVERAAYVRQVWDMHAQKEAEIRKQQEDMRHQVSTFQQETRAFMATIGTPEEREKEARKVSLMAGLTLHSPEVLDFNGTNFGDADTPALCALFASGKLGSLNTLKLDNTLIGDRGLTTLSQVFGPAYTYGPGYKSYVGQGIRTFSFNNTNIGDEGLSSFAQIFTLTDPQHAQLALFRGISSLSFNGTQIGDRGLRTLAQALLPRYNSEGLSLSFDDTGISDGGISALCLAFAPEKQRTQSRLVVSLSFNNTQIGDGGAACLGRLFSSGKLACDVSPLAQLRRPQTVFYLKSLSLINTKISDAGITSIGQTFTALLESLNLANNPHVTETGLAFLRKNLPSLKENAGSKPLKEDPRSPGNWSR